MGVVDVFGQDRDSLCIGVGFELKATLLQNEAQFSTVGDDTVVDYTELGGWIRLQGVAIPFRGGTMGSPSRVGNGHLGDKRLVDVNRG